MKRALVIDVKGFALYKGKEWPRPFQCNTQGIDSLVAYGSLLLFDVIGDFSVSISHCSDELDFNILIC